MTLIVDSFAWIELLTAGRSGPKVRAVIESGEELLTPDIVLAEVARVFVRQGMSPERIAGHLRAVSDLSSVRPIEVGVALEVHRSDRDLRQHSRSRGLDSPSVADSLILAFARYFGAGVLRADPHFEGLDETSWIGD